MASVLGKSPPPFDSGNMAGSVKAMNEYLAYMYEQIDYLIGQLKKSNTQISAAVVEDIQNTVQEQTTSIANINSRVVTLGARVTATAEAQEELSGEVDGLTGRVTELSAAVEALNERVTALGG